MRIVSEWNYNEIKVTVLHMNEKFSIKLEDTLLEQTYKFRDGQVTDLAHLKSLLNDNFYTKCIELFDSMRSNKTDLLLIETEEDFDEII